MAASATQTAPKPAKKKNKASAAGAVAASAAAPAAADRTASPAPSASTAPPPDKSADGGPGNEDESPFIREIQKNIRNLVKKLGNTAKTDAVISENPGKSLDELVATKIINSDQRTAIQKKPGLQAQLDQLQEQLGQHRTIDNEYRIRAKAEREELEKALAEKFEREKAAAVEEARQRTADDLKKANEDLNEANENLARVNDDLGRVTEILQESEEDHLRAVDEGFLLVSQFLRLAAARRNEEADPDAEENRALEGILLAVYSGDHTAVDTMKKLVAGSEDKTFSVHGLRLQTTFAQVKAAAAEYKVVFPEYYAETDPALFSTEPEEPPAPIQAEPSGGPADTAETVISFAAYANGHGPGVGLNGFPSNMGADSLIANMAAESQWDNTAVGPSISQGWDMVSPIDVGAAAAAATAAAAAAPDPAAAPTPAPASSFDTAAVQPPPASGSWADDNPDAVFGQVDANEGFHHVQQRRGRGDSGWRGGGGGGNGGFRGGRGGESRGRGGFRGEYRGGRGRGRGGSRGGGDSGFPPRGGQPRRWEDSSS